MNSDFKLDLEVFILKIKEVLFYIRNFSILNIILVLVIYIGLEVFGIVVLINL